MFDGIENIWSKRNAKTPDTIWGYSQSKIYLIHNDHEWTTTPKQLLTGRACTKCYGQKQAKPFESLAILYPHLLKEFSKENNLDPEKISYGSSTKKYVWTCQKCNFSWFASVASRTRKNSTGCPKCNQLNYRSRGELEVEEFLKSKNFNVRNSFKVLNWELDLVLFDKKIAIEYNGEYWHRHQHIYSKHGMSAIEFHEEKFKKARTIGLELIFVWEDDWVNNNAYTKDSILKFIDSGSKDEIFNRLKSILD